MFQQIEGKLSSWKEALQSQLLNGEGYFPNIAIFLAKSRYSLEISPLSVLSIVEDWNSNSCNKTVEPMMWTAAPLYNRSNSIPYIYHATFLWSAVAKAFVQIFIWSITIIFYRFGTFSCRLYSDIASTLSFYASSKPFHIMNFLLN